MSDQVKLVQDMYAAFRRGDIQTILENVTDDVSWEYEAPSSVAWSGVRHGRKEVLGFFTSLADDMENHVLTMDNFFTKQDSVASFGRFQGTLKSNGAVIDTPTGHLFEFRDGKVSRFVNFNNSGALLEARAQQAVHA